ncbi:MAG: transcription termination factor NusA [Deltaproteobacteria bacterium]|nr:transcription termination factor NusA [Deltaproteobacteria bacterium]
MTELKRIIDQISRDKGIDRDILISTLEDAIRSAARKKLGQTREFEVAYNEEDGEIEVFEFKDVVEEVSDEKSQVSLEEGRNMDPECQIGDQLGVKIETAEFGRIAAQSAKQVIIQRMKDAERDIIYEDYKDRKGEIISGMVLRFDKGTLIVNLGRAEAVLPVREQTPREIYRPGDRIRAFVLDVKPIARGPQIILSRTHPQFLIELFKNEVPEMAEGAVQIKAVAREPGSRTKIAVYSQDSDIDPVGACVGMKGSRVQAVVQELRGEKIDIVPWDPDVARFICNALSPAEVSRVVVDEARHTMEVVVPEEMLSLAIGKRGQNVRLSSKLTGWRVDIIHEERYAKILEEGKETLLRVAGVGQATVNLLVEAGYNTARELARATSDELVEIPGISLRKAEHLIAAAQEVVAQIDAAYKAEEEAAKAGGSPEPSLPGAEVEKAEAEPAPEGIPGAAATEEAPVKAALEAAPEEVPAETGAGPEEKEPQTGSEAGPDQKPAGQES